MFKMTKEQKRGREWPVKSVKPLEKLTAEMYSNR